MNILHMEWNILKKSLRILKQNRRLLNLLIPDALVSGIPPFLFLTGILFLISGNVPAAMTALLLALLLTPPALVLHTFLGGVFFSEMIGGFGEDSILIKRGLLSAFIRRKALFRFAVHLQKKPWACFSCGFAFAIPTLVCEEESEDPVFILNRAESAVMHTWHSKGGCRGLFLFRMLPFLICAASIVLSCLHIAGGTLLFVFTFWLYTALRRIVEPVYVAALYCYAYGSDDRVGEYAKEELKSGFFARQ